MTQEGDELDELEDCDCDHKPGVYRGMPFLPWLCKSCCRLHDTVLVSCKLGWQKMSYCISCQEFLAIEESLEILEDDHV